MQVRRLTNDDHCNALREEVYLEVDEEVHCEHTHTCIVEGGVRDRAECSTNIVCTYIGDGVGNTFAQRYVLALECTQHALPSTWLAHSMQEAVPT